MRSVRTRKKMPQNHSEQSERDTDDSKRETPAIASGISNNRNPENREEVRRR